MNWNDKGKQESCSCRKCFSCFRKSTAWAACYYTIGYEGKDIDAFLNELIQNNIQVLVDVRRNPFSLKFAFTKIKLQEYLEKRGIEYVHLGELGIEGEKRKGLETKEDYDALFREYEQELLPANQESLEKVINFGKTKRIALLCFEAHAQDCHRGIIAKSLKARGIKVTRM